MKRLAIAAVVLAVSVSKAFAWGDLGHQVICQIAYLELKPEIKARVDVLIAIDPGQGEFASSCSWPDHPRLRPQEHYVNVARDADRIEESHACPSSDRCVVTAILNDARDLALSMDVNDQLRLLKSLGHWVGDIHQPLHVSFEDDRGGNAIRVSGLCGHTLHSVWDSCIIEKRLGFDYERLAVDLRSSVSAEDRAKWVPDMIEPADIVSWANESLAAAKAASTGYCIQRDGACWYDEARRTFDGGAQKTVLIDDAYLTNAASVVKTRLAMAGLRLGAMLNLLLATE